MIILAGLSATGQDYNVVEGFLTPYRMIEVSTIETGIVESIQVEEGDQVRQGDILVKLRRNVLLKSLAAAKQEAESVGGLEVAKAELKLQESRLRKFTELIAAGHGRSSELERARSDYESAKARLLKAEEEIEFKRRELERIQARVSERDIASPIDGIVVEIHREAGESVSPNNPIVVTVVNLDQLKCVLDVPRHIARELAKGKKVVLETDHSQLVPGVIEWKSPLIDAESETVRVIVRVENKNRAYTSGEYCTLQTQDGELTTAKSSSRKPVSYSLGSRRGE